MRLEAAVPETGGLLWSRSNVGWGRGSLRVFLWKIEGRPGVTQERKGPAERSGTPAPRTNPLLGMSPLCFTPQNHMPRSLGVLKNITYQVPFADWSS